MPDIYAVAKNTKTAKQDIETAPAAPTPGQLLDALLADLRLLDVQLERAIDRVRQELGGVDTSQRGLIIEEGDVDRWLGAKGPDGQPVPGNTPGPEAIGVEGGRLRKLGEMFGLSPLEMATLLTAIAPEVDLSYGNLYAYVHDDVTRKSPTLDLVANLWCSSLQERLMSRSMLDLGAPLRRHLLLDLDETAQPMFAWPLHLDSRIAAYLLASDSPDPALAGAAQVVQSSRSGSSPHDRQIESLQQLARAHAARAEGNGASSNGKAATSRYGLITWMRGPEKAGKMATAEQLAASLGSKMVVVDTPVLVSARSDMQKSIYRAFREAQLQDAVLYWADADALAVTREGSSNPELPAELARVLQSWQGVVLFDIRGVGPIHLQAGPLSIQLDFPAPSNERRRALWDHALNGTTRVADDVDLGLITGAFRLTGEQIQAAADTARHSAAWRAASSGRSEDGAVTMHDLLLACRVNSNRGLSSVARKIIPIYSWNDLVLPVDRLAQLREMCLHIRFGPVVFEQWGFEKKLSRGRGLNVLFAGQPGTGKTMAAEVLASDLGLELYKIDLSSVVSKYIGETEKNLEKIFNEGQTSNAILFFDEADSLFGKRSEVKDSHDRYANIETSYLLQRMEEYDGIVILATNLRKNLDDAFIRRLHGAIEFPMPEEPDRLEIWQRTFPREAPVAGDVDLAFFARRFKLSGGNIKNIVLEAAFYAAEAGTAISMAHLVKATRREHQKVGRLIHKDDFGQYARLLKADAGDDEALEGQDLIDQV